MSGVPNSINEEESGDYCNQDLIINFENYLNDEPFMFIVSGNGEMTQIQTISENNTSQAKTSETKPRL